MKTLLHLLLITLSLNAYSQTFDYTGTLPASIPDSNVNIDFPIYVSGLPMQIDPLSYSINRRCF